MQLDHSKKDNLDRANMARLHWACRRGMLELDLLLEPFLCTQYEHLSPSDQALFATLLACKDTELFAWLLGSQPPADQKFIPLINMIRQHARPHV